MALKKIIEVEGNSVLQTSFGNIENGMRKASFSAYIKVTSISGNKNKISANINFKNNEWSFDKQYQIPVSVDVNSANFIAQTYEHLKTLPEFAEAVDC